MRLKKIKLAGFKSFVEPTSIPFPGDMTAVVGPNGCGKSNVIDAVRWVLGESSAKNLRGDAMTDVIFNGSSSRKPVGQCSVELTFDNSTGRIGGEFANYNELAVKRLVTRDAQSTYFLNGTKCRRRDVTDLFLGTGLGPRSYAIIEQGMISRLIESKPHELRVFIEEAAGISKYKERRRETENRIKHTQDNLSRLDDVRDELASQLAKLERQAEAATRYKVLRAKVRLLKGELFALRLMKNNEQTDVLKNQIQALQKTYDEYQTRLGCETADTATQRAQVEALHADIEDYQQQLFTCSTAITRLEQSTLHAKQRKAQIEDEMGSLSHKRTLLITSLDDANQAIHTSNAQLSHLEPVMALKEAELDSAKTSLEDAEQALREFNHESRDHEQHYHSLKRNVQECHSQIQSTMSMQLRTSQRISELNDELNQIQQNDGALQVIELQQQLCDANEHFDALDDLRKDTSQAFSVADQALSEHAEKCAQLRGEYQKLVSTIGALEALQEDAESQMSIDENNHLSPLWQALSVPAQYEVAVESILSYLNQPLLDDGALSLSRRDALPASALILTQQALTATKTEGTLASVIRNDRVPRFFNAVYVVNTKNEALAMAPSLSLHQSVVSLDGFWCGLDWVIQHGDVDDGVVQRSNKLIALESSLHQCEAALEEAQGEYDNAQQRLHDAKIQKEQHEAACREQDNVRTQLANKLAFIEMQIEQFASRAKTVQANLEKQTALLKTEEQQLSVLSEKLEEVEGQILAHEVDIAQMEEKRENHEQHIVSIRRQIDSITQENHELVLKKNNLINQRRLYEEQVTRNQQQLKDYDSQDQRLREELATLVMPEGQQKAELQQLLAQKTQVESKKGNSEQARAQLEAAIKEAEKTQSALQNDMQHIHADIEKLNIEVEGYKVRANTIIEQLAEGNYAVNDILSSLPDNAQEAQWESDLNSVQANLNRLGAVNLAAVEEFEEQSARKKHLDIQYGDLVDALETLQSAIRKIDKETRTRFSNTFEQVNEDLKQLFPKVFGGGSAYLALTDDDLLETGVTIMARPPGKKNSTIHLLSGGEKALTALSLVFAIFRLNPAPFCLLDEVDAPLDDANVGRFCNLVSEMSQTVQFIYITHNKIAMEMASHLTGVTMAEPGVSRMVAVDVDEAIAFAEA